MSIASRTSGGSPAPAATEELSATVREGSSSTRLEGFLTKKGGVSWKRRWFTLEDHVITYLSKQGDLRPRGRMVLIAESRVTNLPTRVHAFQVITNAKALMVYADTAEDRERWVTALDRQIAGLKERALQRRSRRNVRCGICWGRICAVIINIRLIYSQTFRLCIPYIYDRCHVVCVQAQDTPLVFEKGFMQQSTQHRQYCMMEKHMNGCHIHI